MVNGLHFVLGKLRGLDSRVAGGLLLLERAQEVLAPFRASAEEAINSIEDALRLLRQVKPQETEGAKNF